jgi:hypothetical protein
MDGPFYITPDGKFPTQDGVPVLITQAEFEACCCDPCACESENTPKNGGWASMNPDEGVIAIIRRFATDTTITPNTKPEGGYVHQIGVCECSVTLSAQTSVDFIISEPSPSDFNPELQNHYIAWIESPDEDKRIVHCQNLGQSGNVYTASVTLYTGTHHFEMYVDFACTVKSWSDGPILMTMSLVFNPD